MANFLSTLFSRKPSHPRLPRFAGHLYPEPASELEALLTLPTGPTHLPGTLRALVVPGGDMRLTREIAAPAYALLARYAPAIERVVLISAAQRIPFQGLALSGHDAWRVPTGSCRCDAQLRDALLERFPERARLLDAVHDPEPDLEVQLPWLLKVFGEQPPLITPILAGDAADDLLDAAFEAVWGGQNTLIVLVTQLATGVSAQDAQRLTAQTQQAIEALDGTPLTPMHLTSRKPLGALLRRAALTPGARAHTLATGHSLSVADPTQARRMQQRGARLVEGYAAVALMS